MRKRYYLWAFFILALFYTLNFSLIQHRQHHQSPQAEKPKEEISYVEIINEIEFSINPGQLYRISRKAEEKPVGVRFLLQTPEASSTTSFNKKEKTGEPIVYQQQNPSSRPRKPQQGKVSKVLNFTQGACGRKQGVPYVFWETAEDYESESINHVAKWFCNNIKPKSKDRIEVVRSLLTVLTQFFEQYKLEYWLDRGTLLGSIRNESFIPWDVDADVGLTFDTFKSLLRIVMARDFAFPCNDCSLLLRAGKHSHVIPFKFINTTNGMYVDSFLYFRDDFKSEKRLVTNWPLIEDHRWIVSFNVVFPLKKTCRIDSEMYWCPNNSTEYTSLWYGTNWTIPLVPKGWDPNL